MADIGKEAVIAALRGVREPDLGKDLVVFNASMAEQKQKEKR